jgi:hypothetical protein
MSYVGNLVERLDKLMKIPPEKWHPVDRWQAVSECRTEILKLQEQVNTWYEVAVRAYTDEGGWSRDLSEEMAREAYAKVRDRGTG